MGAQYYCVCAPWRLKRPPERAFFLRRPQRKKGAPLRAMSSFCRLRCRRGVGCPPISALRATNEFTTRHTHWALKGVESIRKYRDNIGYWQYWTTVRPNTISLLDARISDPIYRDIIGCVACCEKYHQKRFFRLHFGEAGVKIRNIDHENVTTFL